MRLALYQPDIPQNTGTLLRTAACLGVAVDIIEPAGFDITDRALRRAGLDYLDHVEIRRHGSFGQFEDWRKGGGPAGRPAGRLVLLSARAEVSYATANYAADDILLLGRESAGVPEAVRAAADMVVGVPMRAGLRSLNVAVAGAMILGEALRQCGLLEACDVSRDRG